MAAFYEWGPTELAAVIYTPHSSKHSHHKHPVTQDQLKASRGSCVLLRKLHPWGAKVQLCHRKWGKSQRGLATSSIHWGTGSGWSQQKDWKQKLQNTRLLPEIWKPSGLVSPASHTDIPSSSPQHQTGIPGPDTDKGHDRRRCRIYVQFLPYSSPF